MIQHFLASTLETLINDPTHSSIDTHIKNPDASSLNRDGNAVSNRRRSFKRLQRESISARYVAGMFCL